jgi:uncharacterized protein YoxC
MDSNVFSILLMLSASALCISLIYYFLRITKAVEALQNDVKRISEQINPLLESLNTLSRSIKALSEDLRMQLQKTNWVIDQVKGKVEGLLAFEKKVKTTLENPAQNILNTIQFLKDKVTFLFRRK